MIRTRKAAQAWVKREGAVVREGNYAFGDRFIVIHPDYKHIVMAAKTMLEAVNALITAIDDARASDARARESEIPW